MLSDSSNREVLCNASIDARFDGKIGSDPIDSVFDDDDEPTQGPYKEQSLMCTLGMSGAANTHVHYGQPSQTWEPPVTGVATCILSTNKE
jgi:hypothetical protein